MGLHSHVERGNDQIARGARRFYDRRNSAAWNGGCVRAISLTARGRCNSLRDAFRLFLEQCHGVGVDVLAAHEVGVLAGAFVLEAEACVEGDGAGVVGAHAEFDAGEAFGPGGVDGGVQEAWAEALVAVAGEDGDAECADVGAGVAGDGGDVDPADDLVAVKRDVVRGAGCRERAVVGVGGLPGGGLGEGEVAFLAGDNVDGAVQAGVVAFRCRDDGDGIHGGIVARGVLQGHFLWNEPWLRATRGGVTTGANRCAHSALRGRAWYARLIAPMLCVGAHVSPLCGGPRVQAGTPRVVTPVVVSDA